jgi:hypothetical protein
MKKTPHCSLMAVLSVTFATAVAFVIPSTSYAETHVVELNCAVPWTGGPVKCRNLDHFDFTLPGDVTAQYLSGTFDNNLHTSPSWARIQVRAGGKNKDIVLFDSGELGYHKSKTGKVQVPNGTTLKEPIPRLRPRIYADAQGGPCYKNVKIKLSFTGTRSRQ